MYVEASGKRPGQKAQLISQSQSASAGSCLRFWYHMNGDAMGTLNVYLRQAGQLGSAIFTRSGNQGNRWALAETTVTSPGSSWEVGFVVHVRMQAGSCFS
jgi:hypothetical protein